MLRFTAPFFLLAAFILLLLVSLSIPIIKSIYIFDIALNLAASALDSGATSDVRFGVWGWCSQAVTYTVIGITHSTAAQCSPRHLGYTIDPTVMELLQLNNDATLASALTKGVTAALVLHPIACGLTFLALLLSIHHALTPVPSRISPLLTLPVTILASLITTIIFVVDVAFVAVANNKIQADTDGDVSVHYGNAPWMVLGAMLALWFGMGAVCGGVCCNRRRRYPQDTKGALY